MKKKIMDQEGYEKFKKDIENLENELNKKRQYKGKVAIYQGDTWHDNPTLYQTELEEKTLMKKLNKMKEQLKNIEIIEKQDSDSIINIGDTVNIALTADDGEPILMTIKLVGYRGDVTAEIKEISTESPLGASILEKNVGDIGNYNVEGTNFSVQILEKVEVKNEDTSKANIKKR